MIIWDLSMLSRLVADSKEVDDDDAVEQSNNRSCFASSL